VLSVINDSTLYTKLVEQGIPCLQSVSMAEYTTMRVGGMASLLSAVTSAEQLIKAVRMAQEHNVRFAVIGNGSNVVFSDDGFSGLVIVTTGMKSFSIENTVIKADCGVSVTRLATEAQRAGLSGLEFAYGIPGTVGGGVYMNAGAYGGSLSDVVVSSICFDTEKQTIRKIDLEEHEFSYRHSIYTQNSNLVILAAMLELTHGDKNEIAEQMNAHLRSRKEKQPLELPSAGSVFKRPIGYYAGELIEKSGLKGYRIGGAEVSEKHAGFIVNRGGATADDVKRLVEHIKHTVYQNYGVELDCEIKFIR
jgi:UDP-N-acetylmuramate dehydrogenase